MAHRTQILPNAEGDLLTAASQRSSVRTARVSSWDHSGLNEDAFVVPPGETAVLADIEGPGKLTHLWFVQTCRRILGPGLIPYSKSGVAMMEVHNALGLNYEDNDPGQLQIMTRPFATPV